MATGDITYGAASTLSNIGRLHSSTDGQAKTFGEVQNSGGAVGYNIQIVVPIAASSTGSLSLYLVESINGTEWTDNIDPTSDTGDVAAQISDARQLAHADATYDASNRTEARFHVHLDMLETAEYFGFVVLNNSGQTLPGSGADGDSVALNVS